MVEKYPEEKDKLIKFSLLIIDVIKFGENLLKWDLEKEREGFENTLPALFLSNILELGDAISILIKNATIDPCTILLRSLLENTYGLGYLVETEEEKRALSFVVCQAHKKLKLFEKLDSSTTNGEQFKNELKKDRDERDVIKYFDNPNLMQEKQNCEALLELPECVEIEKEYQRILLKNKRVSSNNIKWFSFFEGPKNIIELAQHLKLHASYEILYRGFSENVHATKDYGGQLVLNDDGSFSIIRNFSSEYVQVVTTNTIRTMLMSYRSFYEARLHEKEHYCQNWLSEFVKKCQDLL